MKKFEARAGKLSPEAHSRRGAPLYLASALGLVLENEALSDDIGITSKVLEGTEVTGIEKYIAAWKGLRYVPAPEHQGTLPDDVYEETIGLAYKHFALHESRIGDKLQHVMRLQTNFPGLLYRIHRRPNYTYLGSTLQKVLGFERVKLEGDLVTSIVPRYDQPIEFADEAMKPVTLCDITQFGPKILTPLKPHIIE